MVEQGFETLKEATKRLRSFELTKDPKFNELGQSFASLESLTE